MSGLHWESMGMYSMHVGWWLFWLVIVAAVLMPFVGPHRKSRRTALERLQNRYAAGEMSTEEYEQLRSHLSTSPR